MGFLIKYFKILLLVIIAVGCSKPIVLKDAKINQTGYFSFLKNSENYSFIDKKISDSLKIEWRNETHGSYLGTSVIAYDDYLFVPDLSGRLYCFDDSTGKELGVEKYKGEIAIAPIIYDTQIIYAVNEYREVFATIYFLDFIDGEIVNEIKVKGNLTNEFLLLDDGFLILTEQGNLIKLDFDGEKIWNYYSEEYVVGDPFYYKGSIYFATTRGNIFCVGSDAGDEKFVVELSDRFESTPIIIEGKLYIGDVWGNFYKYNISRNEIDWIYESGEKIRMQATFMNGKIYFGNLAGNMFLINAITGDAIWTIETDGVIDATPLVFTNKIIQPDLRKRLFVIDIEKGEITKTKFYDGRARLSPVFYRNKIYVGTDRGELFVYKVEKIR